MKLNENKCYLCGDTAESVEHCPPKCFFPKGHRNNIITVPSCSVHNQETSLDDEYARLIITMNCNNNTISFDLFKDKVLKSIQRNPALRNLIKLTKLEEISKIQIDRKRLEKEMTKIAYALYYYEKKTTWNKELIVAFRDLVRDDNTQDELGELIEQTEKRHTDCGYQYKYSGDNPDVFKYVFFEANNDDVILKMVFYEGFDVWICPSIGSHAAKY